MVESAHDACRFSDVFLSPRKNNRHQSALTATLNSIPFFILPLSKKRFLSEWLALWRLLGMVLCVVLQIALISVIAR